MKKEQTDVLSIMNHMAKKDYGKLPESFKERVKEDNPFLSLFVAVHKENPQEIKKIHKSLGFMVEILINKRRFQCNICHILLPSNSKYLEHVGGCEFASLNQRKTNS